MDLCSGPGRYLAAFVGSILLAHALNEWRIFAFVLEIGNQAFKTCILTTHAKFQLQVSPWCIFFKIIRNAKTSRKISSNTASKCPLCSMDVYDMTE